MAHKLFKWASSHKLVIFLTLLSTCLLISTLILALKYQQLSADLNHRRNTMTSAQALTNKTSPTNVKKHYRLPRHVIPKHYNLALWPDLTNKTFDGVITMTVEVLKPTNEIIFHAANKLTVRFIKVYDPLNNETNLAFVKDVKSDEKEFVRVTTADDIPKGDYRIDVEFHGRLNDSLVGFYASTLNNGKTMVASKFEPTYARQAFPCFDEPEFKATFDITLVKPPSYIALSNMNQVSQTRDNKSNTDSVTFATSVPMSTYLACFVICDFASKETEVDARGVGNNFTLRSFAQKQETHKIDFAQDIGRRATEFYIDYYQVPFPLPKLDMIAIPDYQSGATEHWGLVTYRETSFLLDARTASAHNRISVANTIAHELAHMWFGNLVTMKWWNDLWLNEGFATYMQVKALNALEPSWSMLDQFLTKTMHRALAVDSKLSSHPIVQTVETPDQITALFDTISYDKGASILRMLEGFIGPERFRRGVTDYLKKHEFGSTVTQELLASLEPYFAEEHPALSLSYILDTWTRQMGYPLLSVSPGTEPDTFVVRQSRFLQDPDATYQNDSQFKYRWFVPITYRTSSGAGERVTWLPDSRDSVTVTVRPGDTWLKLNNDQVGYYRVNYTEDLWAKLIDQLKTDHEKFSISDRAHLISELFSLASSRQCDYTLPLASCAYLPRERAYVPWQVAGGALAGLAGRLRGRSDVHALLQIYAQSLLRPHYEKLSWEKSNLTVIEGLFRTQILTLATHFELPAAKEKVRSLFLAMLNARQEIEPDLRGLVYSYGMKSATAAEWDRLWSVYLAEQDVHEQGKLRTALAAPEDPAILRKFLSLAWEEGAVRGQDYLTVLVSLADNPAGTDMVWSEVTNRWPALVERFTLNSRYLGNMVVSVTNSFDTDDRLSEMESFFTKYPEAGAGEGARRRALETVRTNIKWVAHNSAAVAQWLQDHATQWGKQAS